jgi:subtilisin-like proprotein convertase family protein
MESPRSENRPPAAPDDAGTRSVPPADPTRIRVGRGTALKVLGAALIGGLLGAGAGLQDPVAKARPKKRPAKRAPKRRPTPPRPPIVLTKTFANRARIRLDDNARANPYPSTLQISRLKGARILDVNLVLHDLSHGRPLDLSVMVVSPSGRGVTVMHKAGGNAPVSGLDITVDDQAAAPMPYMVGETFKSGTYKPSIYDNPAGYFPSPAPEHTGLALSDFYGENPNGEWQLYVFDDTALMSGEIATGWSLVLTYQSPAPVPRKKKRPKKRRRPANRQARR